MAMARCHLITVPTEVRMKIFEHIDQDCDRQRTFRALSQTCSFLFDLFKHELYHTLVLRADSKSGRSVQRISGGSRATLVKRLVFRARDPKPAWDRKHDPRYQLSIPSKQVLTFLHRFPNLIEFELDVDWKLDLWFSDHPEPRLYPVNGYSETYRVILDQTLRAIGRSVHHNNARALTKLCIRRLPPRMYRALIDHGLHTLLNDLHSFHIEFLDHYGRSMAPMHQKFVSNLHTYFLDHLQSVRTLHLQASPDALIGEAHGIPAIDFGNVKLPFLRKLTLAHHIIDKETENFIFRHLATLHCVVLDNCYREHTWSTLFRRIITRKPSKLTRFDVTRSTTISSLPLDDNNNNNQIILDDHDQQQRSEDEKTFPRIRVYCGHIWSSPEDETEELKAGVSLAAWLRLQRLVGSNRRCWERFSQSRPSSTS